MEGGGGGGGSLRVTDVPGNAKRLAGLRDVREGTVTTYTSTTEGEITGGRLQETLDKNEKIGGNGKLSHMQAGESDDQDWQRVPFSNSRKARRDGLLGHRWHSPRAFLWYHLLVTLTTCKIQ